MKWYIEYPIIWIITFVLLDMIFIIQYQDKGLAIFTALILGTLVSAGGYAGYYGVKKKQKMQSASEEEKVKMKEKERETNKIMIWIIIILVLFCICMIALFSLL